MNKIYWIPTPSPTTLATMARPRGADWLRTEIEALARQNVTIVVSLLTDEEIDTLALTEEANLCAENGIVYKHFPILDRTIPKNEAHFKALIQDLVSEAKLGKNIVAHCRAGIGRSSLTIAAILLELVWTTDHILATISKARGVHIPGTTAQAQFLRDYEKTIKE